LLGLVEVHVSSVQATDGTVLFAEFDITGSLYGLLFIAAVIVGDCASGRARHDPNGSLRRASVASREGLVALLSTAAE
jgi:hypothetical protein